MAKHPFYVILTLSLLTSMVSQDGMAFWGEGDEKDSPGHPSSYINADDDDDNDSDNNHEASSSSSPRGWTSQGHLPSLTLPTFQRLLIIGETFMDVGRITERLQNMGERIISTLFSFLPAFLERGTNDENQEHSYSGQEDIEPSSSASSSSSFLPSLPSMVAYNVDSQEDIEPSSSAGSSSSFLPSLPSMVAYVDESLQQSLLTHFALHYFYQQYCNSQNQGSSSACSPDTFQRILDHSSLGDGLTFEAFFDHLPLRAWRNLPAFTEYLGKRYAITDEGFLQHLYGQRPTFSEEEMGKMARKFGLNIDRKGLNTIKTFPRSFFYQLPHIDAIRETWFFNMDTEESLFYLSQLCELFVTTQDVALQSQNLTLVPGALNAQILRSFPTSPEELNFSQIAEVHQDAFMRAETFLSSLFPLFFHYGRDPLIVQLPAQAFSSRTSQAFSSRTSVNYYLGVIFLEPRLDLPATDQRGLSTQDALQLLEITWVRSGDHYRGYTLTPRYALTPQFIARLDELAAQEEEAGREEEAEQEKPTEGKGKERAPED